MVNGLFIGVLSGTSMNSIDVILVEFNVNNFIIKYKYNYPFKQQLAQRLLNIIHTGACCLSELGTLDRELGVEFARAIQELLLAANISADEIVAIGSHGQNVWHHPDNPCCCSMQIGDPNVISAITGITTVADFRRKDIALGGQGAPLAPGLHRIVFADNTKNRAIINIGGISNITIIPKDNKNSIIGFDLGPGNCLMDEWIQTRFSEYNLNYDQDGKLAAQGSVIPELLTACLNDSYFSKSFPKSTGREYFNLDWLAKKTAKSTGVLTNIKDAQDLNLSKCDKHDVLCTLLHVTVRCIQRQIVEFNLANPKLIIEEVYLCGGGSKNLLLLDMLQQELSCYVSTASELGLDPEWVEAVLFAWLARQTISHHHGNITTVTGASRSAILGGIYLP